MRERTLLKAFFGICQMLGVFMLLPLAALVAYPEEVRFLWNFALPGAGLVAIGFVFARLVPPHKVANLTVVDGMLLALMTWLTAIGVSVIPLMTILDDLTLPQAIFEAASGWTTCGLTVIDVSEAPRVVLLFRSITQYIGGLGFVMLSVLLLASPADRSILVAEGSDDHFTGGVRGFARRILLMYLGYAVLGVVGYIAVGMGTFDAVNHTLTAVSTGGFSTRVGSIGAFDSRAIEWVTVMLMILGAVNFSTVYLLLTGERKYFWANAEVRVSLVLLPAGFLLVFLTGTLLLYPTLSEAARQAAFQTVSALTGTGFSTTNVATWTPSSLLLIIILMSIGGGSGSTTGGLKQNRVYELYLRLRNYTQSIYRGAGDPESPEPVIPPPALREGELRTEIDAQEGSRVGVVLAVYVMLVLLCTFIMCVYGYTLQEALFEASSTFGTVGLTLGVTSADTHPMLLLVQSAVMLLGRLEVFVVFFGVSRAVTFVLKLASLGRSPSR